MAAEIMGIGNVEIGHASKLSGDAPNHWHIIDLKHVYPNQALCGMQLNSSQAFYKFKARPNQGMHINTYCGQCLDERIKQLIEILEQELQMV